MYRFPAIKNGRVYKNFLKCTTRWIRYMLDCTFLCCALSTVLPLQWRHNGRDGVSNLQPHHCLLNRLYGRRSKKTSKLHVTSLCAGNSPGTGEFPAQMVSNAENGSIWWRHHAFNVSNTLNADVRYAVTTNVARYLVDKRPLPVKQSWLQNVLYLCGSDNVK